MSSNGSLSLKVSPSAHKPIVRKTKKHRPIYSADFETITHAPTRVWLWGAIDTAEADDGQLHWGTDIESFFEHCQRENARYDFFNLKFDGHFMVDWLLKAGYQHVELNPEDGPPHKGQFSISMAAMGGKFYSLIIGWPNGVVTEFWDAAKKFPANMGVRGVAKAYKLDVSKGEMDYHKERHAGYQPDAEELDYLDRDVRIIAKALAILFAQDMKKMTTGADALAAYKDIVGGNKAFRQVFPLLSEDIDAEIRKAYRGGWTYLADRFKMKQLGCGLVLDVNSLYPSVMYYEPIPYGEPVHVDGLPKTNARYPLSIFTVTFTAKLRKNHVPCIQIKGTSIFGATEYLSEIRQPTMITVTSVDWELYNEQYEIDVLAFHDGYLFKAATGMFNAYIDKWMAIKATTTGGQREAAKSQLVNLYGKFATNPDVTGKIPVLDGELVKYVRGTEQKKDPVYTAAGVFITAHARAKTIRAAQANYHRFVYADTDSLHMLGTEWPTGILIHPSDLGAWKFEYYFTEALYVRSKVYLEREITCGRMRTAFAGLPKAVAANLTFDDIWDGHEIPGKLQPVSVEGGIVLKDVTYTVKL